jgi:hypothetical protein
MSVVSKSQRHAVLALKSGSAVDGVILACAIFGEGEAARRTPVTFVLSLAIQQMFLAARNSVGAPDRRSL